MYVCMSFLHQDLSICMYVCKYVYACKSMNTNYAMYVWYFHSLTFEFDF